MHVWALGLSCETRAASGPPGLHTTTRELRTCTFDGPALPNTTKKPREPPPERETKRANMEREREKKKRNFLGPPTLHFSTFGPHPSGPHPSGHHPSGHHPSGHHPSGHHASGPHPSGPHPSGSHWVWPLACIKKTKQLKITKKQLRKIQTINTKNPNN